MKDSNTSSETSSITPSQGNVIAIDGTNSANNVAVDKTSVTEYEPSSLECNSDSSSSTLSYTSPISQPDDLQHGVAVADALRSAWTKKALVIAYSGLFFSALIINFSSYASQTYTPWATSSFKAHSMLATAAVVYKIARVITYPIMAKMADVFGRAEGFTFAIFFITLSYIMYASANNISAYVTGYFFDAVGDVGYTIMQQIFIADTTTLINRGLWASLPEAITSIPTLYLGSIVGESMLEHSTWRWGYGMWAIILPVCVSPLIGIMFWLHKKAKANGEVREISILKNINKEDPWRKKAYQMLYIELDMVGAFLLAAGLTLSLIPINVAGKSNADRWKEPHNIIMLVIGILCFIAFLIWDSKFAKKPFIPYRMACNLTIFAACAIGAFDFANYACFTSFFPSYLQVAGNHSPGSATRIDNSLRVSFQIASVFVGILMKYTKRAKIYVYIGVPMVCLGQGLMIYFVNRPNDGYTNEASFITAKVIFGVGRGFYQTASQVLVQAVARKQEVAVATALFLATMNIGAAIGTTIGGAIWNEKLPGLLTEYLPDEMKANATTIFKSIAVAKSYPVESASRIAIDQAYKETLQVLAIVSTCFTIPMLVLMFLLTNVHLDSDAQDDSESHEQEQKKIEQGGNIDMKSQQEMVEQDHGMELVLKQTQSK